MVPVHHRTATVLQQEVFFREAGIRDAPVVVLLHGFPTSSHMFRNLIPALADRYHVIAPDHIGYGNSAMPALGDFPYTFDALAEVTAGLLDQLDINTYSIYVHDYGAPIGWRLATANKHRISAIITQSGNAYMEGFVDKFWKGLFDYATKPGPDTEPYARSILTMDTTRWQYLHGAKDPSLVSPDNWLHDQTLLDRPGNQEIQLQLFRDYANNLKAYPALQEYFRKSQVPLLAVWGEQDAIFGPDGARAFQRDLPQAQIRLLDAGHFALESQLDTIAGYIRGFLGEVVA
jgi:pimeloyl-ACP methyl ester carboxylesterase